MLIQADARHIPLKSGSVQCVVTSPPYWGQRKYPHKDSLGFEKTPDEYVENLVTVFREVYRVLRKDGTLWLNLGDCYATGAGKVGACPGGGRQGDLFKAHFGKQTVGSSPAMQGLTQPNRMPIPGLKRKELVGLPWRVAFALQADGWFLRSEIIWFKSNPRPESVLDRPTRAHEQMFLLTQNARYAYYANNVREKAVTNDLRPPPERRFRGEHVPGSKQDGQRLGMKMPQKWNNPMGRNIRSVWRIACDSYRGTHFSTFPPKLVQPCVLAGSLPGDVVFDPFVGSGVTVLVARSLGRIGIGSDLGYQDIARKRIEGK